MNEATDDRPSYFIALHLGAGYHSVKNDKKYKQLCKAACQLGVTLLANGGNSLDVTTQVCSYLEDHELTNAGYASNLTMNGTVECDAAIMDASSNTFGSISCSKCVKNPVQLAKFMVLDQQVVSQVGLVPPMVISGDQATKDFAIKHCITIIPNRDLFSESSIDRYKKYRNILNLSQNVSSIDCSTSSCCSLTENQNSDSKNQILAQNLNVKKNVHNLLEITSTLDTVNSTGENKNDLNSRTGYCKKRKLDNSDNTSNKNILYSERNINGGKMLPNTSLDTIGVICIDTNLNMTSAISSGGIALKQPGRVGHTSHFGCGCWSFKYNNNTSIASCTSGCGELLIKTNLAKAAVEYLTEQDNEFLNFNIFLSDQFIHSPYITTSDARLCGLLVVRLNNNDDQGKDSSLKESSPLVEFHLAHTTESFSVGYCTSKMTKPVALISRMDKKIVGTSSLSQGFTFPL